MAERTWRGRLARRRRPGRNIDIEGVRQLAHEAAAYQDVPVGPQEAGPHRSGFVDVERHPWDWADGDPVTVHETEGPEAGPERWRHQWSVFEADVAPWMSPEERAAAAHLREWHPSPASPMSTRHGVRRSGIRQKERPTLCTGPGRTST